MKVLLFLASLLVMTSNAHAGSQVIDSRSMGFDHCLATIRATAGKLGVAPLDIVETNALRMVRFPTDDGSGQSILITCSAPDRKMVMTLSSPD